MSETAIAEEGKPEEEKQVFNFNMKIPAEAYHRLEKVVEFAISMGLIKHDGRGNLAAWVNFCFHLGEEWMQSYAKENKLIQ